MRYRIKLAELMPRSDRVWRQIGEVELELTVDQMRQLAFNLDITLPARFQAASPDEPPAQELHRSPASASDK